MNLHRNHYAYSITIRLSTNKGFGMFADEYIPPNHLICSNLARPLPKHVNNSDMDVFQYFFVAPQVMPETSYLIVSGEMMFINHDDEPKAQVSWRQNKTGLYYADLFSIKAIKKGSEITIQYKEINRYYSEGFI